MIAFRLLLLLGILPLLTVAGQGGPGLGLSLDEGRPELFVPGDKVLLMVDVSRGKSVASETLTITLDLPDGLISRDTFWQHSGQRLTRRLPTPTQGRSETLKLRARILQGFRGDTLAVSGRISESDTLPKKALRFTFSVAELLSSVTDTCLNIRDTTLSAVNAFISTSRSITARPRGPIDLSPTGPIRISPKKCAALSLDPVKEKEPKKKSKKSKEKCSCLTYRFVGTDGDDYPARHPRDGKVLQPCDTLNSAGRKGDTISIVVKTIDGQPLRDLMLRNGKGTILEVAQDAPMLEFSTVLTEDSATFRLLLRSNRKWIVFSPKQYVVVTVTRKPASVTMSRGEGERTTQQLGDTTLAREIVEIAPGDTTWLKTVADRQQEMTIVYRMKETISYTIDTISATGVRPLVLDTIRQDTLLDTISRDSCQGLFSIQQNDRALAGSIWVPTDTLLAQIFDQVGQVVGQRNPIGQRKGSFQIDVPLALDIVDPPGRDSLIALAYWVGIGEPPLTAYDLLAEKVPPDWGQPGVSPPLAAFGLGYPIVLPGMDIGKKVFQDNYVAYDFLSTKGLSSFRAGKPYRPVINRRSGRANYGVVSGTELDALPKPKKADPETGKRTLRFHLAFANKHQINSYRLRVIVVGYYQVMVREQTWGK